MSGVDMQRGSDFSEQDRQAAKNFGAAARATRVRQIIYLGGLGDDRQELSVHLRSRHEVGDVLRSSGVPVLEFRASIIIGSGSLSFDLIRASVERLLATIMPRWVNVNAQPMKNNKSSHFRDTTLGSMAGTQPSYASAADSLGKPELESNPLLRPK